MGRKLRDDPLALVKEKENERFRKLQANPQKMARMKKLMEAYMSQQNNDSDSSSDSSEDEKRYAWFFDDMSVSRTNSNGTYRADL